MASSRLGQIDSMMTSSLPVRGLTDALPQLHSETELQKMLTDERMRSEQHKTNYQTLKLEHSRLQDEFVTSQRELKATIEDSKLMQDKYKIMIDQMRRELNDKHALIEKLQTQVLTPQKTEVLKAQLRDEVERPYREKFQLQEDHMEKYQTDYNKLKYDYSFLKSEYEHEREGRLRVVDEMKVRHEAEVANLRREREVLINKQQTGGSQDAQRVRVLQRENAQLHLKVKGILTELEEIRAQKEHTGLQLDHATRQQSKQTAEHTASVKSLETEIESLRVQSDTLQKELAETGQYHTDLNTRVHDLEKENIVLRNKAEEVTHKSRVELTNLKMDMVKERGELERERDRLRNEIEDQRSQVEIVKHSLEQQEQSLVEKEREAVKRVQAAREEEWQKVHQIENEKLELESKIQEMHRQKIDDESKRHAQKEKMDDQVKQAVEAKDTIEKELLVIRTKLQHQQNLQEQVERERSENAELKSQLHRLQLQYRNYVESEHDLIDVNDGLKRQTESLMSEMHDLQQRYVVDMGAKEKELSEQQATWTDQRLTLHKRVDELEGELAEVLKTSTTLTAAHKKKKNTLLKIVTKLKYKVELQHAHIGALEIEKEACKKFVPPEKHLQLKKKMNDLKRRQREFCGLLATANIGQLTLGDMTFGSVMGPTEPSVSNWQSVVEDKHEKELEGLRERLDQLDNNQRQQMEEFKCVSPSFNPTRKIVISSESDSDLENLVS